MFVNFHPLKNVHVYCNEVKQRAHNEICAQYFSKFIVLDCVSHFERKCFAPFTYFCNFLPLRGISFVLFYFFNYIALGNLNFLSSNKLPNVASLILKAKTVKHISKICTFNFTFYKTNKTKTYLVFWLWWSVLFSNI